MVKKVEDMDYYELLNLRVDASTEDVRKAYLLAVATYHPDALASYGVLSADERRQVLDRIEQAFQTLGDAEARKAYDDVVMPSRPESRQRAFFRKSTEKLEIEDAGGGERFWKRLKSLFFPARSGKTTPEPENGNGNKGDKGKEELRTLQRGRPLTGRYLKQVREERGLTLENVAQISGLEVGVLRLIEEGETDLLPGGKETEDLVRRYAQYLGVGAENGD